MLESKQVTLVIPLYNEGLTIEDLYKSICAQTVRPGKVIFVNAGSDDNTATEINRLTGENPDFELLNIARAYPGAGRNAGASVAVSEWLAFTDAGITLDKEWLKELLEVANNEPAAEIVYGNYKPQQRSYFDLISTFVYVPAQRPGDIRGKSIASCLIKRSIWQEVGGFPDLRAAEDLIFMDQAEKVAVRTVFAPKAMISWQLRPDWNSAFKKFSLYSKYNVLAGKEKDWHYGVLKQYMLLLLFIAAALFVHQWCWLFVPAWFLGRGGKRSWAHRFEFGLQVVLNPVNIMATSVLAVWIDMATFKGWWDGIQEKNNRKLANR